MPALTVAQLSDVCGGQVEGNRDLSITGANSLESATGSEIAFVGTAKAAEQATASAAGCLLVPVAFPSVSDLTLIRVAEPRLAFAAALSALYPKPKWQAQTHPTALIAASARVANTCFIGPYVTISEHTEIADGCYIGEGSSIGPRVSIGANTTLHAKVVIYANVTLGERVILHSGCVLGADGFGYTLAERKYQKFPQVGTVVIENDVEIGANSCVDRAALGTTRIGAGSKLDNLVHVGHNCNIGQHVAIAAQVGLSGSVTVGDYAIIGGQAGIGERARIASEAIVGGKSGVLVSKKIAAGEPVWGIPARPLSQHLRGLANVNKLPGLREEVKSLRAAVARLEKLLSKGDAG